VEAREMVTLHLLDSLTAARFVRGELVLDLGTGAGLPGIPLALAAPERRFVLLDANAKRSRFCEHVVSMLGLGNVRVVHARAEAYRVPEPFHTIVSRAVAPLGRLVEWSAHLAGPETRRVLLKGRYPSEELEELGPMGENAGMIRVRVPGSTVLRHIALLDGIGFTSWPE
jgi:16S rRNA (guanine527-N7)-methyltransferase